MRGDEQHDLALIQVDIDMQPVDMAEDITSADTFSVDKSRLKDPSPRTNKKSPAVSVSLRVRFFGMDEGRSGSPIFTKSGKLCGIFRKVFMEKNSKGETTDITAECASVREIREFLDK